jgi:hypothetical protein
MGADLDRHAARDLAHRLQQRKRAVVGRHRLIGDAGGAGLDEALRLIGIGREVKVGEEEVARLEQGDLLRLRLLHLHDHVGGGEGGGGVGGDAGAGIHIGVVLEINAHAGTGLDDDLVPAATAPPPRRG